tara:strand:+ start:1494 stop:2264 length:771 start_codon:yes stop_codon:yes gene_type:complete
MQHFFKKSLGQHFLINKSILKKIVSLEDIKGKVVFEIGPGQGALTKEIIQKKPEKLILIEKDKNLIAYLFKLQEKFKDIISVIDDDILNINLEDLNYNKVKIISNLPYNIASTLIIKLIKNYNMIESMVLMVQKEVAERLSARVSTSSYSRLSVLIQLHAEVKKVFDVEPCNFNPRPKVESTVIKIIPFSNRKIHYDKLDNVLKISFRQRRKTIKNNLKAFFIDAEEKILKCDVDPNSRPQDLKPIDFVKLSKILI